MKTAPAALLLFFLSSAAGAVEPGAGDPSLLQAIHELRMKQESEESGGAVRVVQQPVTVQNQTICTPVEQARQRIRDLGGNQDQAIGTVNVTAGHGEVKIDSNQGSVNNSVNVQVVNPNERICP